MIVDEYIYKEDVPKSDQAPPAPSEQKDWGADRPSQYESDTKNSTRADDDVKKPKMPLPTILNVPPTNLETAMPEYVESKTPMPTIVNVPPTNLMPSQSEISSLSGITSGTAVERMAVERMTPRPELLTDEKYDEDFFDVQASDGSYIKLEEPEVVAISSACYKTVWCQMLRSRFFLFFFISVPTVVIPCVFAPFLVFELDHIFLFVLLMLPCMFVFLYMYPEQDVVYIDEIPKDELFPEDEEEDFLKELLQESGIPNYDENQTYSF